METLTITQVKFKSAHVELINEMITNRLETILDDPDSADSFESEESLKALESKLTSNVFVFTDEEKKWLKEEIDNSLSIAIGNYDPSAVRTYRTMFRELEGVKKIYNVSYRPEPEAKEHPIQTVWSESGNKNGVNYTHAQNFQYNDGGRRAAGYKVDTGDCVTRAVAIASGKPYQEIYDRFALGNATQRNSKYNKNKGQKTAAKGIYTGRKWFKDYMRSIGFRWVPTMLIGQGCKVHLRGDELPKGRLVLALSRHMSAMIDGVLHDTYDSSRGGDRCVYGYFIFEK